ncbi:MAG: hypothetical protein OEV49_11800 [candidate division Zixibacteria bacterium]|nr:hypothetical protein [candidate division Zixibacteria bacterium]MDH3936013.1 hypothetical protein [candidate division Zixibacteria bacterium]MDH4033643.1 hypothetical protein [candidate division Zixibacteria bacterium]
MRMLVCVAIVGLALAGPAAAQEILCGDVNSDEAVDISDLLDFMDYLGGNTDIDTAAGEYDHRVGVSICDLWAMVFYWVGPKASWGDCNPTEQYGFSLSATDTVYIPSVSGIREEVTEVFLPVAMTFEGDRGSFHWPLLHQAAGSNGVFGLTQALSHHEGDSTGLLLEVSDPLLGDTVALTGLLFLEIGSPEGNHIWFSLHYERTGSGTGDIVTELTDRYYPLNYTVARQTGQTDADLFRPVVVSVDVSFPMGDSDCNGQLDITDLVTMVDHVFGGGSVCRPYVQPYGLHILDMDCSGNYDISDLVYTVDYMFTGGPKPCNPFAP